MLRITGAECLLIAQSGNNENKPNRPFRQLFSVKSVIVLLRMI
jgi:hypothetical protein